jgi:hypothetical protein
VNRLRLVAASAVLVTGFAACALAVAADPIEFEPDMLFEGEMQLSGKTWSQDEKQWAVRFQRLTDDERAAYFKHRTGVEIDPFRPPPGEQQRYSTFLIQVENPGESPVTFNPFDCWLVTNNREILYPIGMAELGASYRQIGADLPESYRRVSPLLMQTESTLFPGDAVDGLLLYRIFKNKTKTFHVDIKLTLGNGNVAKTSAPYRRSPKSKKKSGS